MAAEKALQNLRISEHLYDWPEIRKFWRGDKWGVLGVMMQ